MSRTFSFALGLFAAVTALYLLWPVRSHPPTASPSPPHRVANPAAQAEPSSATTPAPAEESRPDTEAPSDVADALNRPGGTVQADLRVLHDVFTAWLTTYRSDGNPVGENEDITAALCGQNRLGIVFVPRNHPAINAQGQLCDRWGTPFRFHQRSGTRMEIRSAGADRRFLTPDDAQWAPWALESES